MKIGITGASGQLGRVLQSRLGEDHEIVTFGRERHSIPWTLGISPTVTQLSQLDVFIHLAWSFQDRRKDIDLNVGGTLVLSQALNQSEIPFLFLSTIAAGNKSFYGHSKLLAEYHVLNLGGYVIRPGLMHGLNTYKLPRTKFLAVIPAFSGDIHLTHINDLEEAIRCWIRSTNMQPSHHSTLTIVGKKVNFKDYFKGNSKYCIGVPLVLIESSLWVLSLLSLKYRNLRDSFVSLKSTMQNLEDMTGELNSNQ